MGAPETESTFAGLEDDYQVIRFRIGWGTLSILSFAAILAIQLFGRWLEISLVRSIIATALLAIGGLVLGLIGLKFGRARGAARVGVFLNGAVIGILLLVPLVSGILRRLG